MPPGSRNLATFSSGTVQWLNKDIATQSEVWLASQVVVVAGLVRQKETSTIVLLSK